MTARIQQNTVGVPIQIVVKPLTGTWDPTGLTNFAILLRTARGTTLELEAAWAGAPELGILEHTTRVGSLPYHGLHEIQGHVWGGGRDLWSGKGELCVEPNLVPTAQHLSLPAVGIDMSAASPGV